MKQKINVDDFIASLLEDHMCTGMRRNVIEHALQEQGLKYNYDTHEYQALLVEADRFKPGDRVIHKPTGKMYRITEHKDFFYYGINERDDEDDCSLISLKFSDYDDDYELVPRKEPELIPSCIVKESTMVNDAIKFLKSKGYVVIDKCNIE